MNKRLAFAGFLSLLLVFSPTFSILSQLGGQASAGEPPCWKSKNVPPSGLSCNACTLNDDCGSWSSLDAFKTCVTPEVDVGITCAEGDVWYAEGPCDLDYTSISYWCLVAALGIPAAGCAIVCLATTVGWAACAVACVALFTGGIAVLMMALCDCSSGCLVQPATLGVFLKKSKYKDVCINYGS